MSDLAQKKVEVGEVTYTLQKLPFRAYMDLQDKHMDKNGNLLKRPYMEDLFKHCVIAPKVKIEDFDDDFMAAGELVTEIESFLGTKKEPPTNEAKGKG